MITQVWQKYTAPHSTITDQRQQERTRILASVSLALLLLAVVATIGAVVMLRMIPGTSFVLPVLLLLAYIFSRTPHPESGAWILVFGQTAVSFGVVLLGNTDNSSMAVLSLIFLLVPILFSMLVMAARMTLLLAGITVAGMLLLPVLKPALPIEQTAMPTIAIVLIAALSSVAAHIRERDIQTIESQTSNLEKYSKTLEKEVERILAMSEVGRAITGTRDLDGLLNQVVNLIVDSFDFYHAQVFMIDDTHENAVLRASTGAAGQELLARGHKLRVGSQSVIGRVTSKGETVIASDTDIDAVHRRNELLPHTRAEMALPLRVGGRIIGALDVQSVNPHAFSATDIPVFQTMADQLAVAIENARLFERAQRDLEDIRMLNRQLTGDAWGKYLSGRSEAAPVGFRTKEGDIRPVRPADEEKDELKKREGALSLPLKVRGETIGVLDISSKTGEAPDDETRWMLEAVAERVALALDSARLSEQTQQQAAREQILGHISAQLQSTTDLDTILRIVSAETSRALGTSRGFIHLAMEYMPPERTEG